ncbi:MAG: BamA/TamA family outer membrane protein [Alphaproteobacteria bacterium]|nr:BamA/TamA family outer membrane protein [Alphaproteobacteria bacterium]
MRRVFPALARALAWLGLLLAVGCVSARRRSDTTLVRKIRFRGLGGLPVGQRSRHAVREELVQGASGPLLLTWPFSTVAVPAAYRPNVLPGDAERVETWLGHRGWFDATVGIEAKRVRRERREKAGVVDLIVRIERGRRTRWTSRPVLTGPLPPSLPDGLALAGSPVRRGRGARLSDAVVTRDWLVHALQDRGFPEPRVDMDFRVDVGALAATVAYDVEAGAPASFGPLDASLDAPAQTLERIAALHEGTPFNATRLATARTELLGTGAFDHVAIDVSTAGGRADPRVSGALGRPRHLDLGLRFGVIGGILQPVVHAGWTHDNLAGRLHRLYVGLDGGVALRSTSGDLIPLVGTHVGGVVRDVAGFDVSPAVDAAHVLFQYALPRLDARLQVPVRRPLGRVATLEVRPSARVTRLGLDASSPLWIAVLGRDAVGLYGVGGLGVFLELDPTVPDVSRVRGARLRIGVDGRVTSAAVPLVEGSADLRLYGAPRFTLLGRPVQLSARAEARALAAPSEVPWPERLFLGGPTDFRGFRTGQVGTYDVVCAESPFVNTDPDGPWDRFYVPRGGRARALVGGEIEIQRLGPPELNGALFAEAGWLDTAGLRGAVGAGVRYDTGLGPIRFDLSVRPLAAEDRGPGLGGEGVTFGCDTLPPRRRAFDLLSELGRYQPLDRDFPAINVFFTLGRPF